jgi:hypothetical protein
MAAYLARPTAVYYFNIPGRDRTVSVILLVGSRRNQEVGMERASARPHLDASRVPAPVVRRLRILAIDPSLGTRLSTAAFNEITAAIPWEELHPGPVGEYLEVVDVDPASGVFYRPVDLDHPHLLAENGLSPSESNPQFHQQMVYAVAMTTIQHFERALGRKALWSDRRVASRSGFNRQFVRRLRIYPHAIRDRNAYYSPAKKALLFGYFPVASKDDDNTPGTVVFTCLSHDIVAHETTHALLDGVHPRFNEPTNPDVHAFHEAFADIVALFQHFTYPSVLESQIRRTRGDLHSENLLGQLAQQFGRATGRGAALRDALGDRDGETGAWKPRRPDPHALDSTIGAHARGAILVAAVFRAFLLIYRSRTADLFRIATQGTGTLPDGEIHPDLTARLAQEAARCADRVLQMCIRAIDYCPPVDITFGDFLRGIITADLDFSPEDKESFRVVFIESFREWGISPRDISSMGVDSLAWPTGDELLTEMRADQHLRHGPEDLRTQLGDFVVGAARGWNLESDRFQVWRDFDRVRVRLWKWLREGDSVGGDYARLFGLEVESTPPTVSRGKGGLPAVEIHSVRPAIRRTIAGTTSADLVIEITQRRDGYFDEREQSEMDAPRPQGGQTSRRGGRRRGGPDFVYRAGATILIDPATRKVRRIIRTPGTIADNAELARVRRFLVGGDESSGNAFDGGMAVSLRDRETDGREEPFALIHQLEEIR